MAKADISADQLRARLQYDPETGVFTWLKMPKRNDRLGKRAGHVNKGYHRYIGIGPHNYPEHRLAWLYVHGAWPSGVVDHINGDPADNRLCNLRDVPQSVNMQNMRKARRDSKSGVLGAYWSPEKQCFYSKISVDGRLMHLGYFDTVDKAHAAYIAAKREFHTGCTI